MQLTGRNRGASLALSSLGASLLYPPAMAMLLFWLEAGGGRLEDPSSYGILPRGYPFMATSASPGPLPPSGTLHEDDSRAVKVEVAQLAMWVEAGGG